MSCGCGCNDCKSCKDKACGCSRKRHHGHHGHHGHHHHKDGSNCLAGDVTVAPINVNVGPANVVLTPTTLENGVLRVTSSIALAGSPRSITLPAGAYSLVVFGDASLGTSIVTLSTGSGATFNLVAGQTAFLNVTAGGVTSGF